MVRSMKRALLALGISRLLKEDEFFTLLARTADLLNSRPLTRSPRVDLSSFLTPNHFLVGRAETGLVGKVDDGNHLLGEKYCRLKRHICGTGSWMRSFSRPKAARNGETR